MIPRWPATCPAYGEVPFSPGCLHLHPLTRPLTTHFLSPTPPSPLACRTHTRLLLLHAAEPGARQSERIHAGPWPPTELQCFFHPTRRRSPHPPACPPPADLPLIAPPHLVSSLDHPGLACDWIESVATSFPVHALVSSRHRYETLLAALCSSPASVTSRRLLSQPAVCTPAPAASHLLRQAVESLSRSLSLSSSRLSRSLPSTVPPRRPPPGGLARFARFDRVTDSSRTRHAFAALHKSLSRQSWPGRMSQPPSRPCRKP